MGKLSRWATAVAAGLVVTGSVGCVSVQEHNKALESRDVAIVQRDVARAEASGLKAEVDAYKAQVGALTMSGDTQAMMLTSLTDENNKLKGELSDMNARYTDAMDSSIGSGTGVPIPASLKGELTAFAAKNKDLVEFDAGRGVVRFKSDAAFGKGSADLTPKGKKAAGELAKILSSKNGAGYELMIAGHTDGTPVTNPNTVKAGHKDNWHLSAHRAIAFGKLFQASHVHPRRMAMVGYADQRPVASNGTETGRAQNRRVEVLVLGSKVSPKDMAPSTVAKASKPSSSSPEPTPSFNKDDASADAAWWTTK